MTARRRWVPPFFLGLAIAVVVESGLGLLLFISPGLLPALTVILAVALGSLGLGLTTRASGPERPGHLRWSWLLAVGSLMIAGMTSLGWSFQGGAPETGLSRGMHLAGLIALPLYALGACLATVIDPEDAARSGAAAALGGMVGVIFLATFLIPRFEPVSGYLFCILCVSSAALIRGAR